MNNQPMKRSTPGFNMTGVIRSPILIGVTIEISNSLIIAALDSIIDRIGLQENDARLKRALIRGVISGTLEAVLDNLIEADG